MQTSLRGEAYTGPPACALSCLPALCFGLLANLTKDFLESCFNHSTDWGFLHPTWVVRLWPTRTALFWPIRTVPFEPIKLREFGLLICIRMDQSGTRGGTSVYISQLPSNSESAFPSIEGCCVVFLAKLKQRRCLAGADKHRPEQTSTKQITEGQNRPV